MDYESLLKRTNTYTHFQKIGFAKRHGISVALFSLRTKNSLGIGQYLDLIPLIDWLVSVHMNIVQLLPLNDSGKEPSPYSALSSCALHPIYLSLEKLPFLKDFPLLKKELKEYSHQNEKPFVEWSKVQNFKTKWLKKYFHQVFIKIHTLDTYQVFLAHNPWLLEYAIFKTLKDLNNNKHWQNFPTHLQKFSPEKAKEFAKIHKESIDFYSFIQYFCHQQLSQVKTYAGKNNVLVKGDIPILLNWDSSDVFFHQHLFFLDRHAGAPPDFYNAQGQNWHFPPFNWEEAKKTSYHWWKQRLQSQSAYFHCYRIDHVVGFFRIWSIEKGKTSLNGKFFPKNLYLWPHLGKNLLKMMIEASSMLPLAEDLGTIPAYVFSILKSLGILGTRVLRWEKYHQEDGSFIPLDAYDPLSLTTLSTHDSEITKVWWKKYPLDAQALAQLLQLSYSPALTFTNHLAILQASHNTTSFFHINPLQEYTSLFLELSWENLEKERINTPGISSKKNWRYRTKVFLEELIMHEKLQDTIREIVS